MLINASEEASRDCLRTKRRKADIDIDGGNSLSAVRAAEEFGDVYRNCLRTNDTDILIDQNI